MIITYFGKQFFKIGQGDLVIAFNPVSKSSKTGISVHFGSDIALVTTNHPDYNGTLQLSHGDREPFVISGPGDYEVKEIFIKGVASSFETNNKKYINTIYTMSVDNISIAFLGALSNTEVTKEALEVIDGPDILFLPIGGDSLLSPKDAVKFASSIEPKIIIPMDYDNNSLKLFLREIGEEDAKAIDKLTLKRKDLENKESEVVLLSIN